MASVADEHPSVFEQTDFCKVFADGSKALFSVLFVLQSSHCSAVSAVREKKLHVQSHSMVPPP